MRQQTLLETLAEYAIHLRFEDLPSRVVSKANDCFFDLVGCYYAALKLDKNKELLRKIRSFNPTPEVSLWGYGEKCGMAEAALAIGSIAYDLEYDDGISESGHWGSSSIPASFLAVQNNRGNGKDLLSAIVVAYEVGTRISRLFSPQLLKKHVHFPCTMGAFAAATGYAKGVDATSVELTGALSLAGLFPVGTYSTAISGASGKALYSGWPNYLGINVVRLSKIGLAGDSDILENTNGFSTALGLGVLTNDMRRQATEKLGQDYRFMEVYFKPYPCCRWLHAPISAALKLVHENNISINEIEKITVYGPEFSMMYDTHEGFESTITCQYSIPYSVGAAIFFGELGLEQYKLEARTNPELLKFINCIDMKVEQGTATASEEGFRVAIQLRKGASIGTTAEMPWSPRNPPNKEELIKKFNSLTKGVLSPDEQCSWNSIYKEGFEKDDSFNNAVTLLKRKI